MITERTAEVHTALAAAGLDPAAVLALVEATLDEDLDGGVDVTTVATVPADHRSTGALRSRGHGVVAGLDIAALVFEAASRRYADAADDPVAPGSDHEPSLVFTPRMADGDRVRPGDVLADVAGPTRPLLTGERTALNLLGHLSGVASHTRAWADALAGTTARVRDTRKTTPGLRALEKYAVRCGGGVNHRMSLSDAALVKDNHVVAAGGVVAAFAAVRRRFPGVPVEVEVDSLEQFDEVVAAGADLVLLDNFTPAQMAEAVSRLAATGRAGAVRLEASGGLTLASAAAVAAAGVDFVAVGGLTHSSPVLDVGLDLTGLTPVG